MHTKLAVVLLSGLSVGLSLSALAVADGDPVGYMDWSYVTGTDARSAGGTATVKPETNFIKKPASLAAEAKPVVAEKTETVVAKTVPAEEGLTLTYVDEAAPVMPAEKTAEIAAPKKTCAYQTCQGTMLRDSIPVQELHPQTVANKTIVESQIDTRYVQQPVKVQYPITRQYPISVQYPVTIQREVTIEQPVVMQQPVVVRRPVIMQQAVTVQRPTTYVQQQPMIMQQQPTYIQQQPIVMQVPNQNATSATTCGTGTCAQTATVGNNVGTEMQPIVLPPMLQQGAGMPMMPAVTIPGQAISVSQPDVSSLSAQLSGMGQSSMQPMAQGMGQPVPAGNTQPMMPVMPQGQGMAMPVTMPQTNMPGMMPTGGQVLPQPVQPTTQSVGQPVTSGAMQPMMPAGYSYPTY